MNKKFSASSVTIAQVQSCSFISSRFVYLNSRDIAADSADIYYENKRPPYLSSYYNLSSLRSLRMDEYNNILSLRLFVLSRTHCALVLVFILPLDNPAGSGHANGSGAWLELHPRNGIQGNGANRHPTYFTLFAVDNRQYKGRNIYKNHLLITRAIPIWILIGWHWCLLRFKNF